MIAHIFIDAENVKPEVAFNAVAKFNAEYQIDRVDIIGKEDVISQKYLDAGKIYHIQNCDYGKNSADTWLCTEIAKTIFAKPEVEIVILVSSDRDFLPAIKLATDQNKKVIVVSNGAGHKNLKAMLYDLKINPDLIELVDFRTGLILPQSTKKKGPNEPMEKSLSIKKLQKICATLPPNTKNFYIKRESQVKFIFVKHKDTLAEIPFIDGINVTTFMNTLREMKIIGKNEAADKIIAESFLKLVDNTVCLYTEDELNQLSEIQSSAEKLKEYLAAHQAELKTIFVKHGDNLREVSFVEGMPRDIFSEILKKHGINGDVAAVVKESFLDMRDGKIYFRDAEDILNYVEPELKNLTGQPREFLDANKDRIEFIPLIYKETTYKAPFVEGIHLSIFVYMLRELKIFTRSTPSQKVLENNGLRIKDSHVYKK